MNLLFFLFSIQLFILLELPYSFYSNEIILRIQTLFSIVFILTIFGNFDVSINPNVYTRLVQICKVIIKFSRILYAVFFVATYMFYIIKIVHLYSYIVFYYYFFCIFLLHFNEKENIPFDIDPLVLIEREVQKERQRQTKQEIPSSKRQ